MDKVFKTGRKSWKKVVFPMEVLKMPTYLTWEDLELSALWSMYEIPKFLVKIPINSKL
ncbi:MAG: hypothetical protein LBD41_06235 [Clostridiales Family XIII bacterium]|nr:hypothetical protein [Clostridiales Family XIII bacterium]